MDKEAKQQYMDTLREKYLKAGRKEKGQILNEFCRNTGQERKYVIKKFRYKVKLKEKGQRKKRAEYYDNEVKVALVLLWNIFDHPCGQRLSPLLEGEVARLRTFGELVCSDEVAEKLRKMPSATIDRKLKYEKEVLADGHKYTKKNSSFLGSSIPTRTSMEQDRSVLGTIQMDCVEHCGASAQGDYAQSLTTVDICSGWWEGEAFMGKGQERTLDAVKNARYRMPLPWAEIHPDNGGNFINYHLYGYTLNEGLDFSRSRPYKKNDNCFVEQKNDTHVRQVVGYLRYDTNEEIAALNDLYRNELRLYKNFFQPVMKLVEKVRVLSKIHKRYDTPKTPYRRLMESLQVSDVKKEELRAVYESLNPALLKRTIDEKLKKLQVIYRKKNGSQSVDANKKLTPSMVSIRMMQK